MVVWVTFDRHELELHGQQVSYRVAGSGPALLLLHGIANSSDTWARVAPLLSEHYTVIAPDLLGHEAPAHPGDVGLGLDQRALEALVVEVGGGRLAVLALDHRGAEAVVLVGLADEQRVALGLRVERDHGDRLVELLVELADGVDGAHGGLAAVDDREALEGDSDHAIPV